MPEKSNPLSKLPLPQTTRADPKKAFI